MILTCIPAVVSPMKVSTGELRDVARLNTGRRSSCIEAIDF